jgi:hypothetical protein
VFEFERCHRETLRVFPTKLTSLELQGRVAETFSSVHQSKSLPDLIHSDLKIDTAKRVIQSNKSYDNLPVTSESMNNLPLVQQNGKAGGNELGKSIAASILDQQYSLSFTELTPSEATNIIELRWHHKCVVICTKALQHSFSCTKNSLERSNMRKKYEADSTDKLVDLDTTNPQNQLKQKLPDLASISEALSGVSLVKSDSQESRWSYLESSRPTASDMLCSDDENINYDDNDPDKLVQEIESQIDKGDWNLLQSTSQILVLGDSETKLKTAITAISHLLVNFIDTRTDTIFDEDLMNKLTLIWREKHEDSTGENNNENMSNKTINSNSMDSVYLKMNNFFLSEKLERYIFYNNSSVVSINAYDLLNYSNSILTFLYPNLTFFLNIFP